MKLGNKKSIMLKMFLIFILMLLGTTITISYLYSYNSIDKEDYLTLMLSDSYDEDIYTKIVEIISDRFNPLNLVNIKASSINFSLKNRNVDDPKVYIYSKNQDEKYKGSYNVNPTLLFVSYCFNEKLNDIGIKSIFEDDNVLLFSKNNDIDNSYAAKLFVDDKKQMYSSINYFIELGRSEKLNTVNHNNKKYSKINLYANKTNISFVTKLNNLLNDKIPNISKIYLDVEYDNIIKIDVGGKNNSMREVLKSIEILSLSIKEAIDE